MTNENTTLSATQILLSKCCNAHVLIHERIRNGDDNSYEKCFDCGGKCMTYMEPVYTQSQLDHAIKEAVYNAKKETIEFISKENGWEESEEYFKKKLLSDNQPSNE